MPSCVCPHSLVCMIYWHALDTLNMRPWFVHSMVCISFKERFYSWLTGRDDLTVNLLHFLSEWQIYWWRLKTFCVAWCNGACWNCVTSRQGLKVTFGLLWDNESVKLFNVRQNNLIQERLTVQCSMNKTKSCKILSDNEAQWVKSCMP